MAKKKKKKTDEDTPSLAKLVDGKWESVSPEEARKVTLVKGTSQPEPRPKQMTELEKERERAEYYRQRFKRANAEANYALKIAAMQESGYVDAILKLAEKQAGVTQQTTKSPKKNRGAQNETIQKLEELRNYRLEAIKNGDPIPAKALAMSDIGISRKTWKKHDKKLYDNWFIKSYK